LRVGAKANVPMRAGRKLFLKNAGGKKIKNIGSAMSVGLLAVRCQYGLYVVVHLSKFGFSFFCFHSVNVWCVVSFLRLLPTVSGFAFGWVNGAQNCQPALNLNRSTQLQVRTSTRLTQNPCYLLVFLSAYCFFIVVFVIFQCLLRTS
jgi:hypothetical protein